MLPWLFLGMRGRRFASAQCDARAAAEQVKMRELGCASHPAYRLVCYLDHKAMVTCRTDKYGAIWPAP